MSVLAEKIKWLREISDWSMEHLWEYLLDRGYRAREIESAMNEL